MKKKMRCFCVDETLSFGSFALVFTKFQALNANPMNSGNHVFKNCIMVESFIKYKD